MELTPGSGGSSGGKLSPTWRGHDMVVSLNVKEKQPLQLSLIIPLVNPRTCVLTEDDLVFSYLDFSSSDGVEGGCSSVHHC